MRLPIPENPAARPFVPADFTALLTNLDASMDNARVALAQLGDQPFALEVRLADLWFDINMNGTRDEGEDIASVAGLSVSAPADRLEESWLETVKATAAEISATLGHRG